MGGLGFGGGGEGGFGVFFSPEGEEGAGAVVVGVGIGGGEGEGAVVGGECFLGAGEEEQRVASAVVGFGGERGALGVLGGEAIGDGGEEEVAGLQRGRGLAGSGFWSTEGFFYKIEQRAEWRDGGGARAVQAGGATEGFGAAGGVACGGEFLDFGGRGNGDGLGFGDDFLSGHGAGEEDVVADEAGVFGGDLFTAGTLHHGGAGALEDLLDGEAGRAQVGDELLGVEAVRACAVRGGAPGVGGKSDERPSRRIHFHEATGVCGVAGGGVDRDGRGAAGIEDDEVAGDPGVAHFGDGLFGVKKLCLREQAQARVARALGAVTGLHGEEIICPCDRDAVAGVVKEADFRTAQFGTKLHHRREQFIAGDVVFFDHGEAERAQCFRHRPRIIHRIAERADGGFVASIADDQRHARPRRPSRRERAEHSEEESKEDGHLHSGECELERRNAKPIASGLAQFPAMISLRTFCPFAAAALLAGCAATAPVATLVPGDPTAPSQVTPSEAVATAQRLTSHSWQPFSKNILHAKDRAGVLVDTPDAGFHTQPERPGWWLPGAVNVGIPYKWGGFDDAASFDAAIAAGRAAGDVSSPAKRRADNVAVSAQAAGVDCSGFVSRCLGLPTVHDTTQLPAVCAVLASAAELRPGDLLNFPRRHVILCAGWATPDHAWLYFYETGGGPDYWRPGLKQAPLDALLALGYQPLRYRGMATEPRTEGKQILTRAARSTAAVVTHPTLGEP